MQSEKGNLSINSENILPIIKKWLYSDADIFIRELVSNGADAIKKLKLLAQMGEAQNPEDETYKITVTLDKEAKTITVTDNGIGMTGEEITKYITEIAFSGATDFVAKFGEKTTGDADIIGHFGLGFYSSFMVADKVTIESLSYQPGATPARWECEGGIEYELSEGIKDSRGTAITLHIGEDGKDFLEEYKLRSALVKYCGFMPVEIYFDTVKPPAEPKPDDDTAEGKEEASKPSPINDTNPLWLKAPGDCTDEEYKEFYHHTFHDFNDPLFWIHLNMDYPFRLKGILYFPRLKHELESIEGQVKLYSNQVFIAENIKEVIPEFLLLLKGALDCPDLPLNVSRSFLQNDNYVGKLSGYITKKVADKLNSLFKKDREQYNGYWDDISPFIKYGCIKEKDFYEKVKDSIVFKTTAGDYAALKEFLERNKDKTKDTVFYVTNENQQAQYIKMFKDNGMEAVYLTTRLDNPFISYLESYDRTIHFNRIDSDLSEALKEGGDAEGFEALKALFTEAVGNDKLKVSVSGLKTKDVPAVFLLSEQSRRFQEMSQLFGSGAPDMFASEETITLNSNNPLVQALEAMAGDSNKREDSALIARHLYDLALMSHKPLTTDAMNEFLQRSNDILLRLAK